MEHIRTVLEQVVKGRLVGPEEMAAALAELSIAEAIQAGRTSSDMVFQAPEITEFDEALVQLGTTFLIFQTFLREMHDRKQCAEVSGKVADRLISAHKFLLKHHFELEHIPMMHFSPVVYEKKR